MHQRAGPWQIFRTTWNVGTSTTSSTPAPSRLSSATNDLHDNRFLRPDGANLAAFLYLLREKYASEYDLIRRTVRLAAPFFEDFSLEPLALNPDKIRLEWRHKRSDAYFDASSLSDGTLRFMALATLLLQPEALRPSVILVDEPELGLHPYALELLAARLVIASIPQEPGHSGHAVADPPGPLRTGRRARDRTWWRGERHLTRLDANDLEAWLAGLQPWRQLWEQNELGGRAAKRVDGAAAP